MIGSEPLAATQAMVSSTPMWPLADNFIDTPMVINPVGHVGQARNS